MSNVTLYLEVDAAVKRSELLRTIAPYGEVVDVYTKLSTTTYDGQPMIRVEIDAMWRNVPRLVRTVKALQVLENVECRLSFQLQAGQEAVRKHGLLLFIFINSRNNYTPYYERR